MKKENVNKLLIVAIFAIAMGFLETVVVVYLRKIYYVAGFNFPLKGFIEPELLNIEWVREFATIVMLVGVAILAGKKLYSKFAYFLYAFAVWDFFYYVFLKMILDWPSSIFTWDLLFLIPWPWIGPVLAPILWDILFVVLTIIILNFEEKGIKINPKPIEGLLFILGIFLALYTWLVDYGKLIIGGGFSKEFFTLSDNQIFSEIISSYVPQGYNWSIFLLGVIISSIGIFLFYLRIRKR